MTTHADVANLVANAIDGAEFAEGLVRSIKVASDPCGTVVDLTIAHDPSTWRLSVLKVTIDNGCIA